MKFIMKGLVVLLVAISGHINLADGASTPLVCPTDLPTADECPPEPDNLCVHDGECPPEEKCCFEFCDLICIPGIPVGSTAPTATIRKSLQGSYGDFTSPGYPAGYPLRADYIWSITVPTGKIVKLKFTDFYLEGGRNCNYDFVEIRDGLDVKLGTFCGNLRVFVVRSSNSRMIVKFKSDGSVSYKGFKAIFSAGTPGAEPCLRNWTSFGNSSYKICKVATSEWITAQTKCQDMGAHLVKIDSAAENTFVAKLAKSYDDIGEWAWIGLTRGSDNLFYWFDGTKPLYFNWNAREPNNVGGAEHCGQLSLKVRTLAKWSERTCDVSKDISATRSTISICERETSSCNPLLVSESSSNFPRLSASSRRDLAHSAINGTMITTGAWCHNHNTSREWLEVDLGAPHFICGVSAVGDIMEKNRSSVTWFHMKTSLQRFADIPDNRNTSAQEYETSKSLQAMAIRTLENKQLARFIRFVPRRWTDWPCLKVQLYGNQVPSLKMTIPIHNTTVEHVSDVELRCLAYGFPHATYTWTKKGSQLILNSQKSGLNSTLKLRRVDENSEGWYTCRATNGIESVISTAYLAVHLKPVGILTTAAISDYQGNNVVLWCAAAAKPLPNVTWIKPRNGGASDGRLTVNTYLVPGTNRINSTLIIKNLTFMDIGSYTCKFSNYRGSIESGILVRIKGCHTPLAVANPSIIPDAAFTASSYQKNNEPKHARVGGRFWKPVYGDLTPWVQVDLGIATAVTEMFIRSYTFRPIDYRLQFSMDGVSFSSYKSGKLLTTKASLRPSLPYTTHIFVPPIHARFFRVLPMPGWSVSIQMELYGCPPKRVPPRVFGLAGDLKFEEGATAQLTCQTKGWPYVTYVWIKSNPNIGVTTVGYNKRLTLVNLNKTNTGTYTCVARNIAGNDSFTLTLDVHSGPVVTGMAERTIAFERKYLRLSCRGEANPRPTVTWYKDGKQITSTLRLTVSARWDPIGPSVLNISNIGYQDGGEYACVFSNYQGSANISTLVTVHGPPKFTETPNDTMVKAGDDVILSCSAFAVPIPTIRWMYNRNPIADAQVTRDGSLILENVQNNKLYEGEYTCEASNRVDKRTSSAKLVIHTPPKITIALKNKMEHSRTQTAVLHCDADGDPQPTFEWKKNDVSLRSSGKIFISKHSKLLTIKLLEQTDTGRYECIASNVIGNATTATELRVSGPAIVGARGTRDTSTVNIPVIVVLVVVIVVLLLLNVYHCYHHRHNKAFGTKNIFNMRIMKDDVRSELLMSPSET